MFLRNKNVYCKIEILGYEFHKAKHVEDLDWLNIRIEAQDDQYGWAASGSYLRASELRYFSNWFIDAFLQSEPETRKIDFLENEIAFEYDAYSRIFKVIFDYALHPKREKYDYEADSEYSISFKLDCDQGIEIMKTLKEMAEKYPIRQLA